MGRLLKIAATQYVDAITSFALSQQLPTERQYHVIAEQSERDDK